MTHTASTSVGRTVANARTTTSAASTHAARTTMSQTTASHIATTTARTTTTSTNRTTTAVTSTHVTTGHRTIIVNNFFFGRRGFFPFFPGFGFGFGFGFVFPCNWWCHCRNYYAFGPSGYGGAPYLYNGYASDVMPYYAPDFGAPGVPSDENSVAPEAKSVAQIDVRLPVAAADVWFDGKKTTQTGDVRFFESPVLQPGRAYVYEVRATWTVDGEEITKVRRVTVRAGDRAVVDFTSPPRKDGAPDKLERSR
jgi:uncharacterized protein (TIGR03000 family)